MKTQAQNWIRFVLKSNAAQNGSRLAAAGMLAATLGLGYGTPVGQPERARLAALDRSTRITPARASWKNSLGNSRTGRVILHTVCLIRHPERATWHWHGILREFAA
jgi:hypothetical protein